MSDSLEIQTLKIKYRKKQSLLRKEISNNLSQNVFNIIAERVISTIKHNNIKKPVVSGFLPIGSEIDVRHTLDLALKNDFEICLPCVVEKDTPLIFRKWRDGNKLIKEKFGTQAPTEQAKILIPNVIITPLLAFDKKKYRLGYGGGFYDRTIAQFNQQNHEYITIGVALDMQKVDEVPIGTYDEALNFIITEKKIYK